MAVFHPPGSMASPATEDTIKAPIEEENCWGMSWNCFLTFHQDRGDGERKIMLRYQELRLARLPDCSPCGEIQWHYQAASSTRVNSGYYGNVPRSWWLLLSTAGLLDCAVSKMDKMCCPGVSIALEPCIFLCILDTSSKYFLCAPRSKWKWDGSSELFWNLKHFLSTETSGGQRSNKYFCGIRTILKVVAGSMSCGLWCVAVVDMRHYHN